MKVWISGIQPTDAASPDKTGGGLVLNLPDHVLSLSGFPAHKDSRGVPFMTLHAYSAPVPNKEDCEDFTLWSTLSAFHTAFERLTSLEGLTAVEWRSLPYADINITYNTFPPAYRADGFVASVRARFSLHGVDEAVLQALPVKALNWQAGKIAEEVVAVKLTGFKVDSPAGEQEWQRQVVTFSTTAL